MTSEQKISYVVGFDLGGTGSKKRFRCQTTEEVYQGLEEKYRELPTKDEETILNFLKERLPPSCDQFKVIGIALACTMVPKGANDRRIPESSTKFYRLAEEETEHKGVIRTLEKYWKNRLGTEVFILNDGEATSLAVYESLRNEYKDKYKNVMVVTLGKSIGVGFVFNGKHYIGPYTSRASHIILDPLGDWCVGENHRRCWKTLAGHDARKKLALNMGFHCINEKGEKEGKESKDIYELAKQENKKASLFFEFYAERVAKGIGTIAGAVPIQCVVIAGGVANAKDILMDPLKKRLRRGDLLDPDIAHLLKIKTLEEVTDPRKEVSGAYGAQLYALKKHNGEL